MSTLESLKSIGFSENEAKTYLALLADYPATGYQISKKAGIPRSMIYEILGHLASRGAVMESYEGRATLYRPLEPEILLNEHHKNLVSILANLKVELGEIYSAKHDQRVWTITDLESIYSSARQMITNAKSELFLIINDQHANILFDPLQTSHQSGIKIHTLATGEKSFPFTETAYHPPLESEIQGIADTLVVIADQDEVLIAQTTLKPNATLTNNPNLVLIARQFIWMELFTQRIYSQIGNELVEKLDLSDKMIFQSMTRTSNHKE